MHRSEEGGGEERGVLTGRNCQYHRGRHTRMMKGRKIDPIAKVGSSKYGNNGKCSRTLFEGLNISESTKEVLIEAGNHGLARSTWSTYNTAERMLATCSKQRQRRMELPLSKEDLLEFIGWLIEVRKLKAGSINSYLSGLRQLHILKGMEAPMLRTDLVKFVLKGKKNMENIVTRKGEVVARLPITMNTMRLLKEKTRSWEASIEDKLLMWTIATLAFHGAFRIHELLCRTETEFDPDFALLSEDVKVKQKGDGKVLEVKIKCPKESKTGKAVILEVYETKGKLCPVKAFERWTSVSSAARGLPLFRNKFGTPITGAKMNKWLRSRLEGHVNYSEGKFTSHSFRIGLATTLGTLGFSEADIKEAGRWSSNAYQLYMKLPQVKRAAVAKKIAEL